ncbi:ProQ/FINO family protein [Serratia sp. L9]|uniref:ProQ/FINO family protein n=1 Tax=Serratia sp. L9 TaxID=3423946 RepID=UPI003D674680
MAEVTRAAGEQTGDRGNSGYWPGLFDGQQARLLKINIREDFFHDIEQRGLPLSHKVLRRCLKSITRSPGYLSRILTNAPRYDLDGEVQGYVTELESQLALERLALTEDR